MLCRMPFSSHYYPIIIPLLFHDYPFMIPWLFHYFSIIIPLSSHYFSIIIPLSFHDYSDHVAALGTRHQASIPPVAQLLTAIGSASGRLTEKHHRERRAASGDGQLDGQQLEFQPLPSGKLTYLWKITIFNGKTHYKWAIFNSYVSFPEGKCRDELEIYHNMRIYNQSMDWFQGKSKPETMFLFFFHMRIFCMMFQKRSGTMWNWVRIQLCWSLSFGHLIWFVGIFWPIST